MNAHETYNLLFRGIKNGYTKTLIVTSQMTYHEIEAFCKEYDIEAILLVLDKPNASYTLNSVTNTLFKDKDFKEYKKPYFATREDEKNYTVWYNEKGFNKILGDLGDKDIDGIDNFAIHWLRYGLLFKYWLTQKYGPLIVTANTENDIKNFEKLTAIPDFIKEIENQEL